MTDIFSNLPIHFSGLAGTILYLITIIAVKLGKIKSHGRGYFIGAITALILVLIGVIGTQTVQWAIAQLLWGIIAAAAILKRLRDREKPSFSYETQSPQIQRPEFPTLNP